MGTIIPLFTPQEQPCSELAVLRQLARLNRATSEKMRAGLELLCVVDPVGFEVALPAARPDPDADAELGEPVAVCGRCGSMVALFPEDLAWRHYRGAAECPRRCRRGHLALPGGVVLTKCRLAGLSGTMLTARGLDLTQSVLSTPAPHGAGHGSPEPGSPPASAGRWQRSSWLAIPASSDSNKPRTTE